MTRSLVIGATGGIGAALLDRLAREGEAVGCSRADGLDLRDPDAAERALAAVDPPFDVVMVATGVLAPEGGRPEKALEQMDAAAMREVMAVNAVGTALVLRHLPRLLAPGGRCGVLTARVGSIGDNRMGGWYAYRASKAAANMLVRCAAIEMARRNEGSVVVALHPGTVETAFTEGYRAPKIAVAEAADRLVDTLMAAGGTGAFLDNEGGTIPW